MRSVNMKLPIEKIVIDEELYPRNNYFWQTSYEYKIAMQSGSKFPRVVVGKLDDSYILIDGRHRLEAMRTLIKKKEMKNSIDVEVLLVKNRDEIYLESIKRNITHGLKFSIQEKLKIACKLKDLSYDTKEICGLLHLTPANLKMNLSNRLINSITGEDIILKKEFLSAKGGMSASTKEQVDLMQEQFKGTSPLDMITELIVLIKTKTIDLKDKKIKAQLKALKLLLRKIK